MIRFVDNYFSARDDRGSIVGLINFGTWRELNLIRSEAGVIRGNHYHESTEEGFVILHGKIEITLQKVRDGQLVGEVAKYEVSEGSVFLIDPMVNHKFFIKAPSVWMNFLSRAMDPSSPDIYRVSV